MLTKDAEFLLFLGGVPIVIFLFVVFLRTFKGAREATTRERQEAIKRLSSYLPGSISGSFQCPIFHTTYSELACSVSFYWPFSTEFQPQCLTVKVCTRMDFKLNIYDKFLYRGQIITWAKAVRVDDEAFKAQFLIFSNKPDRAASYLSNNQRRESIRELYTNGFSVLLIDGKKIMIKAEYGVLTGNRLEEFLEPQKMTTVLEKLTLLARGA